MAMLVACQSDQESGGLADTQTPENEEPPGDDFGGVPSCFSDQECEAVASSCCDCPTFAISTAEGFSGACEDVMCDGEPAECPAREAICSSSGECILACSPVVCELSCADGFVVDESGCSVCACAEEPLGGECVDEVDCIKTAADCCGCARGGTDTAVPAAELEGFQAALGCDGSESCPEVDSCDASEVAACVLGQCTLVAAAADPDLVPTLCGTAENPTCPDESDCVLNSRELPDFAALGVGVCTPP